MCAQMASPWLHTELTADDPLYDKLCSLLHHPQTGLAAKTVKSYIDRVKRIRRQLDGAPIIHIICQGEDAISRLEAMAAQHGTTLNTLKADIGVIQSLAKHVMSGRQKEHTAHYVSIWSAAYMRIQQAALQAFDAGMANSEKQQGGFVPYSELCAVRDALPQGDMLRLWLALNTMIPAARAADYANCKLFFHQPTREQV